MVLFRIQYFGRQNLPTYEQWRKESDALEEGARKQSITCENLSSAKKARRQRGRSNSFDVGVLILEYLISTVGLCDRRRSWVNRQPGLIGHVWPWTLVVRIIAMILLEFSGNLGHIMDTHS